MPLEEIAFDSLSSSFIINYFDLFYSTIPIIHCPTMSNKLNTIATRELVKPTLVTEKKILSDDRKIELLNVTVPFQ